VANSRGRDYGLYKPAVPGTLLRPSRYVFRRRKAKFWDSSAGGPTYRRKKRAGVSWMMEGGSGTLVSVPTAVPCIAPYPLLTMSVPGGSFEQPPAADPQRPTSVVQLLPAHLRYIPAPGTCRRPRGRQNSRRSFGHCQQTFYHYFIIIVNVKSTHPRPGVSCLETPSTGPSFAIAMPQTQTSSLFRWTSALSLRAVMC
jgi:hypothetical protein